MAHPEYPGILRIAKCECSSPGLKLGTNLAGLPRTVLGIPRYLVSWDPFDSMPSGTAWDCPGYPRILSILGSIGTPCLVGLPGSVLGISGYVVSQDLLGLHAWWDYLEVS